MQKDQTDTKYLSEVYETVFLHLFTGQTIHENKDTTHISWK